MLVGIITGSRAEYGLLEGLIEKFKADLEIETKLIITGSHLSREYMRDGIEADEKVEMLLSSNTANGINKSIGLGIISFTDLFQHQKYDMIIVLGDRFEILAAVIAAYNSGIPIAHIHGGEETTGSLDNGNRHAISHMSSYHFVAHEEYKDRLLRFGIKEDTIFNVGALGADGLKKKDCKKSGKDITRALVCYYPDPKGLLHILHTIKPELNVLIIKPNPDIDYRNDVGISLSRKEFIEMLSTCDLMIGNSSAGIIEAPALGIPAINLGNRQHGRLMASSVINCSLNEKEIGEAIEKALSDEFQKSLNNIDRPYQGHNVAELIKDKIKEVCRKNA